MSNRKTRTGRPANTFVTVGAHEDRGYVRSVIRIPNTVARGTGLKNGTRVNLEAATSESNNRVLRIVADKNGDYTVTEASSTSLLLRGHGLLKQTRRARAARLSFKDNGKLTINIA